MAIISQTIVECDRCQSQSANEDHLHQFSLSEQGLCVNSISNNVLNQWAGDVERMQLCQDCADDLRDIWVTFSEGSAP